MTPQQTKSLLTTLAKQTSIERDVLKAELKEWGVENEYLMFPSLSTIKDRRVRVIPMLLSNLSKLAFFEKETYESVLQWLFDKKVMDFEGLDYNYVVAIYDEKNNNTWWAFSRKLDKIGVLVDDDLTVSPFFPF